MASRAIPSVNGADSQAPSRADPLRAELLASRASRALDSYPAANSLVPISEAHKGLYDPCIFEPQGDEGKALIASTGHCVYHLMTTTVLQSGVKWAEAVMFVHITVSKELSGSNPSLARELTQELCEGARNIFICCPLADELHEGELRAQPPPSLIIIISGSPPYQQGG